jgi:hypothetical protein
LNYDRELICTASLYFAAKCLNLKKKLQDFCYPYYKFKNRTKVPLPPLSDKEKEEIIAKISIAEC